MGLGGELQDPPRLSSRWTLPAGGPYPSAMAGQLSDFDRRVAAGLKVMAEGDAALEFTPDQVKARDWVVQTRCLCGRHGHASCHQLVARGLGARPFSEIAARMICKVCGRQRPRIRIVDPYRSALED